MLLRKSTKRVLIIIIVLSSSIFIAYQIRHLQYNDEPYVCTHMARDLEDTLESMGIDTKIVVGYKNEGIGGHMWVRVNGVDIDSVSFIPFYWKLKDYQRDRVVYDDFKDYAIERNFTSSKW